MGESTPGDVANRWTVLSQSFLAQDGESRQSRLSTLGAVQTDAIHPHSRAHFLLTMTHGPQVNLIRSGDSGGGTSVDVCGGETGMNCGDNIVDY